MMTATKSEETMETQDSMSNVINLDSARSKTDMGGKKWYGNDLNNSGAHLHQGMYMASQVIEKLDTLITEVRLQRETQSKYDRPMTRDEAAAYLQIHPDTLYQWAVEENQIAYSRYGDGKRALLRFRREDLDAFDRDFRQPAKL